MFNDPDFLRANRNSPVLRWVLEKLEKEKQDQIKVICMTQVTTGEKLIQAQAKLSLVEDSIQTLKKHLTA